MPIVSKGFCSEYEILPLNIPFTLPFSLNGPFKFIGNSQSITLACSNRSVRLSPQGVITGEGWPFLATIQSSAKGRATVEINVNGTSDLKISFLFSHHKDVFQKKEFDLLLDELKYIAPETDKDKPQHVEYRGRNYCMAAAERGLSELLDDDRNFYACERVTHARKNSISFSNKSAVDRGKHFQKLGYTGAYHHFNEYKIDHSKKDLIYNAKDKVDALAKYNLVAYDIIEFTATGKNKLTKLFENDIKGKEIGYHIYYFTVTDGQHTLLLLIDKFSNPCQPTYEIWDQHGRSSSYGLLADIAEGVRRQTSWTFASSCVSRFESGKTKHHHSTDTFLWKIKEK